MEICFLYHPSWIFAMCLANFSYNFAIYCFGSHSLKLIFQTDYKYSHLCYNLLHYWKISQLSEYSLNRTHSKKTFPNLFSLIIGPFENYVLSQAMEKNILQ